MKLVHEIKLSVAFALFCLFSVALAVPATAAMVAGWDFSQYAGPGFLTVDGMNFVDTLDANYSDLDPTFGAGAESAAFGTLHYDGQFGSTGIAVGTGTETFVSTTGSLVSNLDAPGDGTVNPFDSFTILASEGQLFTQLLSMTASEALSVVFAVDLTGVPETGSDWRVSFAGKTFNGISPVGIEFSTDGSSYTSFGSVDLTTTDTPYTVVLDPAPSETAFVKLSFDPVGADQPIIDNVAIHTPEPASAGAALALLLGLAARGRRAARAIR